MKVLYKCDPVKNIRCSKSECYLYGGKCKHTKNPAYGKQPLVAVLILPVDKEDVDDE